MGFAIAANFCLSYIASDVMYQIFIPAIKLQQNFDLI